MLQRFWPFQEEEEIDVFDKVTSENEHVAIMALEHWNLEINSQGVITPSEITTI